MKIMGTPLCFTLGHNLPSEVERATKELYEQNGDVKHLIVDLSFPLEQAEEIPDNITHARLRNSIALKEIARKYDSTYVKLDNIGVSQNWTQVFELLAPADDDVLIGVDPDERVQTKGWVHAMMKVFREGGYALVSLGQEEMEAALKDPVFLKNYGISFEDKELDGVKVHDMKEGVNMALIGLSGRFLRHIGSVPYPTMAPRYGWIEGAVMPSVKKMGGWAIMQDYIVTHTLSSSIYGQWKEFITSRSDLWPTFGQPDFGTWLRWKKAGLLP